MTTFLLLPFFSLISPTHPFCRYGDSTGQSSKELEQICGRRTDGAEDRTVGRKREALLIYLLLRKQMNEWKRIQWTKDWLRAARCPEWIINTPTIPCTYTHASATHSQYWCQGYTLACSCDKQHIWRPWERKDGLRLRWKMKGSGTWWKVTHRVSEGGGWVQLGKVCVTVCKVELWCIRHCRIWCSIQMKQAFERSWGCVCRI